MKTVALTIYRTKVYGKNEYLEIATCWDDAQEAWDWCNMPDVALRYQPELYLRNTDKELYTKHGVVALRWDRHPLNKPLPTSEMEF